MGSVCAWWCRHDLAIGVWLSGFVSSWRSRDVPEVATLFLSHLAGSVLFGITMLCSKSYYCFKSQLESLEDKYTCRPLCGMAFSTAPASTPPGCMVLVLPSSALVYIFDQTSGSLRDGYSPQMDG